MGEINIPVVVQVGGITINFPGRSDLTAALLAWLGVCLGKAHIYSPNSLHQLRPSSPHLLAGCQRLAAVGGSGGLAVPADNPSLQAL